MHFLTVSDGTSHILLSPLELMEKLAVLVWPPGFNRTRYHGVFAPNAAMRPMVVLRSRTRACGHSARGGAEEGDGGTVDTPAMLWADLLKRVFKVDVFECPRCQARMQKLSVITKPKVIRSILECVGMPADSPVVHPLKVPMQIDFAI